MRSGAWSEYLSVLVVCALLVGLFGLHAHAPSGREPQGEVHPDAVFDRGIFSAIDWSASATPSEDEEPLGAPERELIAGYEQNWQRLALFSPMSRQRRLAFIAFDTVLLKAGRYLEHVERLEAVEQTAQIIAHLSPLLPAPAAAMLAGPLRNAEGIRPYVARARWRLGLWDEAMAVAEVAFLDQPRNPDAVMMYAFLLAQREPDKAVTRTDALTLRNLFARVVDLDPQYTDEGFSLTADLLAEQVRRVDADLKGFRSDPVVAARTSMKRVLERPFARVAAIDKVLAPFLRLRERVLRGAPKAPESAP